MDDEDSIELTSRPKLNNDQIKMFLRKREQFASVSRHEMA